MLEIKNNSKPEKEWVKGSILKERGFDESLFILIYDSMSSSDSCYNTMLLHDEDELDKIDFELNHGVPVSLDFIKESYILIATPDEYKMTLELP